MKDVFLLAHPMLEVSQDVFVGSKNENTKIHRYYRRPSS